MAIRALISGNSPNYVNQSEDPQVSQAVPILLVIRTLDHGGIERDVTKLLTGIDRTRFTPHVAVYRREGLRTREVEAAGVPILDLEISRFTSPSILRSAFRFLRYVRSKRIRVVHAWDGSVAFAAPLARLLRVPLILSSALGHRNLFDEKTQKQLSFSDSFVDGIVVNCLAMKRHMVEDHGISPARIRLCYNGVETGEFFPKQGPKQEAVAHASLVIGSVCVLRPEKRIEILIEAFARVRDRKPGLMLLIVGSGPELSKLTEKAASLRVEDRCVFVPSVANVAPYLRSMDIYVSCSSSEAFSNSILEAMACGCCPVGSRVGGTPELIEDGKRGLLFESGNVDELAQELAVLIENDSLRKKFASQAAEFASQKLNMQIARERIYEIYTEGLSKKGNFD